MIVPLTLKTVISVTAGVAVLYPIGILLEVDFLWLFALFCLALGVTVWMVVRILNDLRSTDKTLDDYFYLDRPDIRRVGRE